MALFELHCCKAGTVEKALFYYDNQTNELLNSKLELITWDDYEKVNGETVPMSERQCSTPVLPVHKDIKKIKKFRIKLGMDCNYRCSYCLQDHDAAVQPELLPLQEFLSLLPEGIEPQLFEFWGGEPFLYWDIFKPLAEALRKRFSDVNLYVATNGSLLDYEKTRWLEDLDFHVSVSHDGPGQHLRGKDPLQDPIQRAVILDLFHRRRENFSFNPTLCLQNQSRQAIDEWFQKELGEQDFNLGEGALFTPSDPKHKEFCLSTYQQQTTYRRNSLYEIRMGLSPHMSIGATKISLLFRNFLTRRATRSMLSVCGMLADEVMAIDLAGNVLTCQNCQVEQIAPNGKNSKLGHLNSPDNLILDTAIHWSERLECIVCPVLPLCMGGCLTTTDEVRPLACDNWFSDAIPFLVSVIESLTGYLPFYINGPQPEDRKDIFGAVESGDEQLLT